MRKNGFTLIELLVVIAIIAILAAILFPVFISAKQRGKSTQCLSNCRQIGMALMNYAGDWNGWIPKASWNDWTQPQMDQPCPYSGFESLLMKYVKNWKVFLCPSQDKVLLNGVWQKFRPLQDSKQKGCISYGYNEAIVYPKESWLCKPDGTSIDRRSLSDFPAPSRTILLAENNWGWHDTWYDQRVLYAFQNLDGERHIDRSVMVFADGHAAFMKLETTVKPHDLWTIKISD